MKKNLGVKIVTWCAIFGIVLSVIGVGYTILMPSDLSNVELTEDGSILIDDIKNSNTGITPAQDALLKETFGDNWQQEMEKSAEEFDPEWEEAKIIENSEMQETTTAE